MVGKREVIERIVIALLTNGHVPIEDVSGVGKTQCVGALAKSVSRAASLGDEISRASAKTQSSLLEVMEERQFAVYFYQDFGCNRHFSKL